MHVPRPAGRRDEGLCSGSTLGPKRVALSGVDLVGGLELRGDREFDARKDEGGQLKWRE